MYEPRHQSLPNLGGGSRALAQRWPCSVVAADIKPLGCRATINHSEFRCASVDRSLP